METHICVYLSHLHLHTLLYKSWLRLSTSQRHDCTIKVPLFFVLLWVLGSVGWFDLIWNPMSGHYRHCESNHSGCLCVWWLCHFPVLSNLSQSEKHVCAMTTSQSPESAMVFVVFHVEWVYFCHILIPLDAFWHPQPEWETSSPGLAFCNAKVPSVNCLRASCYRHIEETMHTYTNINTLMRVCEAIIYTALHSVNTQRKQMMSYVLVSLLTCYYIIGEMKKTNP